jgi:hypothetical protein
MKEKKARGSPTATVERDAARPDRAANGRTSRGGVAGGYGDEERVARRKRDGMRCARSAVVGGLRDSLHATRAAVEEGVVPGGGVTLIRTISVLENLKGENADQNIGIQIVRRSLEEPLRIIAGNGGWEGSVVVNKVKEGTGAFGFNARTGEYEDLIKAGVIDPAKVTKTALKNAASIAGLLLTTECLIAEKKEAKSGAGAMGGEWAEWAAWTTKIGCGRAFSVTGPLAVPMRTASGPLPFDCIALARS